MSNPAPKLLPAPRLGALGPVGSASLQAWNASLQAWNGALQAWNAALEGALFFRMPRQPTEVAQELVGIPGLEDQGVPPGDGVVLAGTPGAGQTPGGHGLQTHQTERLVTTVGEHGIGSPMNHRCVG